MAVWLHIPAGRVPDVITRMTLVANQQQTGVARPGLRNGTIAFLPVTQCDGFHGHFRPIFRIRANTSTAKVLVNSRTHWLGSVLPNVQMAMQLSVSTGTNPKLQIGKCVGQERSSCPLASFLKRWDQCVLGNGDEQKRPNHRAWGGIICSAWIAETVPHR